MGTLVLYSTAGCHLCEQAKALILPLLAPSAWQLREVDIAESDELLLRYGEHIPVLAAAGGVEINWPFDARQIRQLLQARAD